MKLTAVAIGTLALAASANADVIMTAIMDGPLSGGDPKVIELYVDGTVNFDDGWTVERASNANPFADATINLTGTYTDEFVYIVNTSDIDDFENIWGTSGDFANVILSGTASGNGNDAFRLVDPSATVIDQVGGFAEDTTNVYLDSYLYRLDGTGPDGAWVASNWFNPGNDSLDGLDEAGIFATVPLGTYSTIPAPGALALLGLAGVASPSPSSRLIHSTPRPRI
jgi:hypothetical protein